MFVSSELLMKNTFANKNVLFSEHLRCRQGFCGGKLNSCHCQYTHLKNETNAYFCIYCGAMFKNYRNRRPSSHYMTQSLSVLPLCIFGGAYPEKLQKYAEHGMKMKKNSYKLFSVVVVAIIQTMFCIALAVIFNVI